MGGNLSTTPSQSNPSSTAPSPSSPTMIPSNSSQITSSASEADRGSRTPIVGTADPPPDAKINEALQNPPNVSEDPNGGDGDEEDEEEGECGFCLFMKGGGCRDTFIEWEKCVEEGENNKEDIVEKCFQATAALKKCMESHSDYYAPILHAEKAAEEEAVKQLEEEKERLNDQELAKESGEAVAGSEKKESS